MFASGLHAQVGAQAKRPFRENVSFPIDSSLQKNFNVVEALLADQRWGEAIGKLQEIAQTDGKTLVLIQPGKVGRCATYVNVATRCNLLLSTLSVEGRETYRQKVDPQAKRWFDNWLRTRDEAELLRIVRQAFLSSYGDDALLALGEASWDNGDFSAARLWWEQLIPIPENANLVDYPTVLRYPDASIDKAAILARIVMCSILEGDDVGATDELKQFGTLYPLAEGWLAGQQGRFVDLLQRIQTESQDWKRVHSPAEVSTFALSAQRFQAIPETIDVGALRWERPLSPNVLGHQPERIRNFNDPLSYFPVVYDKIVLVNDSDAIRAWNMLTGEPAWHSDRRDPAVIYPAVPDEATLSPDKPCVGVPYYTMTIAGSRLYARMGSPVTCSSSAELRREFASDLVCLDLAQEGKLVWKFAANELFPGDPPWRYEGTPVVADGRAYVAVCRRHPQLELVVACLDAADGRLLWQRPVGAFRATVDDSSNRISHLLLTLGGGRVFLSTDAGAIVALNVRDGRIEWALSYESRVDESPAGLSDSSRKGLLPVLFHGRYVFAAPNDVNSAFCIEADSGRIHWQYSYLRETPREIPDPLRRDQEGKRLRERQWRQLLGVVPGGADGRLIVSGNALSAIDIQTGRPVWERGGGAMGQGNKRIFGRGVIAGDQVFLPLRESIEIFNVKTGERLREISLKTPDASQLGGNLTLAGGMLLISQPNRLAAYSEYSRLKVRLENELTQRPADSALKLQLAELELAEGNPDAAITGFQRLSESIGHDDPSYFIVRRKLCKILQQNGQNDFDEQQPDLARDQWLQALKMADDVTKRVDLLFDLARTEQALKDPAAALRRLQDVLDDERLASVRRENVTAGRAAAEQMSELIKEFGSEAYQPIEDAASLELAALTQASDRRGLQRLLIKYPHSEVVANARIVLVGLLRAANEISEAYTILNQLRRSAANDRIKVESSIATIDLLEAARATDSANQIWQTLSNSDSSLDIAYEGRQQNLVELANRKLQQSDTLTRTRPARIERTWSHRLAPDSRIVVPVNEPPSVDLAAVLVSSRHPEQLDSWLWQCLDWRTGQIRWQKIAPASIKSVAWTPVHLLIGTEYGWQAFSADGGRQIWEQISLAECTPHIAGPLSGSVEGEVWPALFDIDHGLRLYDSNDGQLVANLKPPERLHPIFVIDCGLHHPANLLAAAAKRETAASRPVNEMGALMATNSLTVLMQTLRPTRTWRATASSPSGHWTMEEISTSGEPWQSAPIYLNSRIISMTGHHQLVGNAADATDFGFINSRDAGIAPGSGGQWKFSNFATGQGAPVAFSLQRKLFAVVDGLQLVSFEPSTGIRKWSTGLADFPLKSPLSQICDDGSCVFATSQGLLSCISIDDGKVQFQNYLGDVSPQWRTVVAWNSRPGYVQRQSSAGSAASSGRQALIAAWPLDPAQTGPRTICLCDGTSGTVMQQFHVDSEPKALKFNHIGDGFIWTDEAISGLRFAAPTVVAGADRKASGSRP